MNGKPKATQSGNCCHNSTMKPLRPHHQDIPRQTSPTAPLEDGTCRLERPNTHPLPLTVKAKRLHSQNTNMIYVTTWPLEQARQDPSMDLEGTLPLDNTDTKLGAIETIEFGNSTRPRRQPISGAT